jgi:hypothetical protein
VEEVERSADAAERASAGTAEEPFEPTVGRAASMLVNVPGQVALERSYLAQLRGDAGATAAFAAQVLARSGDDEWLLSSTARGFLAVAEWLHGRLADAERALVSGIAGWQAAGQATVAAWAAFSSARFSVPGAAWTQRPRPASRHWKAPPGPAARRCQPQVPRTWAWARWPTSALHDSADIGEDLWHLLARLFSQEQLLDLLMLAGWYHAISFAANGARVACEDGSPRFADVQAQPASEKR